jgi:hypothetical protein
VVSLYKFLKGVDVPGLTRMDQVDVIHGRSRVFLTFDGRSFLGPVSGELMLIKPSPGPLYPRHLPRQVPVRAPDAGFDGRCDCRKCRC